MGEEEDEEREQVGPRAAAPAEHPGRPLHPARGGSPGEHASHGDEVRQHASDVPDGDRQQQPPDGVAWQPGGDQQAEHPRDDQVEEPWGLGGEDRVHGRQVEREQDEAGDRPHEAEERDSPGQPNRSLRRRRHPATASRTGSVAETRVARPGAEVMCSRPPTASRRSATLVRPVPLPAADTSKPLPSSSTSKLSSPSTSRSRTTARVAPAYFCTFCSASSTQKYTVASTSAA